MTLTQPIIAIIPARSGSKGIPGKNIRPIAGVPLVAYSIEQAKRTDLIDRVFVSTDGDEIAAVAQAYGAEVIRRPDDISGDTASSESALVHALDALTQEHNLEPSLVVFLQATSPLRQPNDIQDAILTLQQHDADSLFSASIVHGFVWRQSGDELSSFSYDYRNRQRRQDAPEDWIENGSIYVFKPWVLRQLNNRLGGKIALYPMHPLDSLQVDEPGDLEMMEQLVKVRSLTPPRPDLRPIRLLVLDFDGVMTDNRVLVDQDGKEAVWVNRSDGWGITRLREAGIEVIVLSTEHNPVVSARCRKLNIEYLQSLDQKDRALKEMVSSRNLDMGQVAYVGNDLNDLEAMQCVGIPIAVADADPKIKRIARLVLNRTGGNGAVREICDLLLENMESF